ncbi:hypothetical protein Ancab_007418 [Ancistrocladus abbreviatus]
MCFWSAHLRSKHGCGMLDGGRWQLCLKKIGAACFGSLGIEIPDLRASYETRFPRHFFSPPSPSSSPRRFSHCISFFGCLTQSQIPGILIAQEPRTVASFPTVDGHRDGDVMMENGRNTRASSDEVDNGGFAKHNSFRSDCRGLVSSSYSKPRKMPGVPKRGPWPPASCSGISRVQYNSPCGSANYFVPMVCQYMKENATEDFCPAEERLWGGCVASPVYMNSSALHDEPHVISDHLNPSALLSEPHIMSEGPVIEPEYCPEAIVEYLCFQNDSFCKNKKRKSRELLEKARKHLSAMGWSFWFKMKEEKQWCYVSPEKNTYCSLQTACEDCIAGLMTSSLPISSSECDDLMKFREQEFAKLQKRKGLSTSFFPKHQVGSGSFAKSRQGFDGNYSKMTFQSSKRARWAVIPSLSCNPRNVLSWLIDNNVVLPRTKVYNRSRKDCQLMAEGWVTCDGIKCSCYERCLLSLDLRLILEAHYTDSANTFLEDERGRRAVVFAISSKSLPRAGKAVMLPRYTLWATGKHF